MPTYTYRCSSCDHQFDVFHSMAENGSRPCPECGAESHKMIGTGAGLIFKGSGFYVTDYKGKNPATNGNGNGHHNGPHEQGSNGTNATETKSSSSDAGDKKASEKKKETSDT